eukprot:2044305-Rhodomonas_salina.2
MLPMLPMRVLRNARYGPSVCCNALSNSDLAYAATRWPVLGMDLGYAATRWPVLIERMLLPGADEHGRLLSHRQGYLDPRP